MDRLIEPFAVPQTGRGQHANGTGEHGRLVGEDVPEHVARQDHVKTTGVPDELHGGVVHQEVLHLHLGIVPGHLLHHVPPEDHGREDVSLVYGGHLLSPLHGGIEGHPGDALNLPIVIDQGIHPLALLPFLKDALGLAKVDAPRELPHHQDIESLPSQDLIPQGRRGDEGRKDHGRPQVGKELVALAQGKEGRPLGLFLRGQILPLGSPHGPEEDGLGPVTHLLGLLGEGMALLVYGHTTHQGLSVLKLHSKPPGNGVQHLQGLFHHLGTYAVPGQHRHSISHTPPPIKNSG